MTRLTSGILKIVISYGEYQQRKGQPNSRPYLLFEISSVLLVDKNQIEIVPHAKFLVDVPERRRQVKAAEEQSNGNSFACEQYVRLVFSNLGTRLTPHWCTIHDLEFGDGFTLVILVRGRSGRFTPNDRQLHMFDLDSHKQEINLADDNIFEVVPSCLCWRSVGQKSK